MSTNVLGAAEVPIGQAGTSCLAKVLYKLDFSEYIYRPRPSSCFIALVSVT